MVRDRGLRNLTQADRPNVIAQGVPQFLHLAERGLRERLHAGIALEKLFIFRRDAVHLRLLEHDLRDEDLVRIARPPPREIALVVRIPLEKTLLNGAPSLWSKAKRASASLAHP